MQSTYNPQATESIIYSLWEKSGYFNPDHLPPTTHNRQPYTIVLPPPNASGKMHTGNVLMIAIEDLLIRWKRMQGYKTLWIPGTDHAGFETQVTFERELKKQGKSRFDYDRKTLYEMIWKFVNENKTQIDGQIRSMGASIDWSRYLFALDDRVIKTVYDTFRKMYEDGLIYRDDYMVNYCPKCGTTFADLEVKYIERKDPLYYIKYGPFTLATVRPETKFGDTALAVHPDDKRYTKYIGKEIEFDGLLGKVKLTVIADSYVDHTFGTGVLKITPAHDKNDYEVGKRHQLEIKPVIGLDGRLNENTGPYVGLSVFSARKKVVYDLTKKGLIENVDNNYIHTVATCYKAGHDIEPMIVPNWFVKVDNPKRSLKKPAYLAVKNGLIKIYPKWREKTYLRWMEEMHDWPISRQIVWGIRIPVWYQVTGHESRIMVSFMTKKGSQEIGTIDQLTRNGDYTISEIRDGLTQIKVPLYKNKENNPPVAISDTIPQDDKEWLPETDTFDTWFSSGQWPLVTLGYPAHKDFKNHYPTDVLETGWEIIRLWVSRMVMFGIYLTEKPPFHTVYLHGIVRARDGRKMSKSLGNVINPDEYQKQYGTDALRMGLISGTANGKDFNFPHDKIIAYRNFANKLWNIARFLNMQNDLLQISRYKLPINVKDDAPIITKLNKLIKQTNIHLEKYRFAQAAEDLYHFTWDDFASCYLEEVKTQMQSKTTDQSSKIATLQTAYFILQTSLKLLHPFMPFVTEAIWQELPKEAKDSDLLMVAPWPH